MTYQREFEKKLKVGIVGAGSHSYRNLFPTLTFLPVSLRAVCDKNLPLAEATAAQYGAPHAYADTAEMYRNEELDAVFICVSPQMHPELTCEALAAGLHVWMEKPPAMRVSEVDEMIAQRGDRIVVAGYKKAFLPATEKVFEIFSKDENGPIKTILGQYPLTIPKDAERVLREGAYSSWEGCCHPLSLMIAVGGPVNALTIHSGAHGGGVCVLEYANGGIGNLHLAHGNPRGQPIERYMFFGNNCTVTIENSLRVTWQRGIPFDYGRTTTYVPEGDDSGALVWEPQNQLATLENIALFTQGFYFEMLYFCNCILENCPPELASLEFARHATELYEAGLMSQGNRIEISAASWQRAEG